jgi:hypothetical protein
LAGVAATNSAPAAGAAPAVTFAYACVFLWGFLWRSFVLTLPLLFVTPMAFLAVMPFDLLGDPAAMLEPEHAVRWIGGFLLVSTVLTLVSMLLMAVAMRWTLADFRRRDAKYSSSVN